jgi:hypothetical protein
MNNLQVEYYGDYSDENDPEKTVYFYVFLTVQSRGSTVPFKIRFCHQMGLFRK